MRFNLPFDLQKIISLPYWCPQRNQNTLNEVDYVFGTGVLKPHEYFGDLQSLARNYIDNIKDYYTAGGAHAAELDKPNAHRLIEFVHHTIPIYGHALNVSEMVLEQAHRNFKRWLETNTNQGSQITGVELDIARDWMRRVHAHYLLWTKGDETEKETAVYGLQRLLLGTMNNSSFTHTHLSLIHI